MFQIEAPVRLSQSRLWQLNTEFYENQGAAAWSEEIVPTRITSNPMIAEAYAQVIAGYLRDASLLPGAPTVSVVELGAGSGQFSFMLLKALTAACRLVRANAPIADFRFVMTDIAESNVEGWRGNEKLRPFVEQGLLDLAVLDVAAPRQARSVVTGQPLADIIGRGPTVVIANYVLDSLVCDAFRVEKGELFEVRVGIETDRKVESLVAGPELFRRIRFGQETVPASFDYYPETAFNDILRGYAADLGNGNFLFPSDGLRFLQTLGELSPHGVLAIVADKGRAELADYAGRNSLGILHTGAFSTMVNFDAIRRWVERQGGQAKMPAVPHDRLDVYAFVLGETGKRGETELAFQRHVGTFGPNYLHWLVTAVTQAPPPMTPRALLALLEISRHDPNVLVEVGSALVGAVSQADPVELRRLRWALERCSENHFGTSDALDPQFALGKLYQELRDPEQALRCFQSAKAPPSLVAYNMAVCYAQLGDADASSDSLRRSVDSRIKEFGMARAS